MGRGFFIQKAQPKSSTSLRGAKRRGNLLEKATVRNTVPGDCHGLRPRNDMLVGTWCRFAGLRWGFRCGFAERHAGRFLRGMDRESRRDTRPRVSVSYFLVCRAGGVAPSLQRKTTVSGRRNGHSTCNIVPQ